MQRLPKWRREKIATRRCRWIQKRESDSVKAGKVTSTSRGAAASWQASRYPCQVHEACDRELSYRDKPKFKNTPFIVFVYENFCSGTISSQRLFRAAETGLERRYFSCRKLLITKRKCASFDPAETSQIKPVFQAIRFNYTPGYHM